MRKSVIGGHWIDLGGEDWDAVRAEAPSGARPPMGRSYVMESLAKTLVSICDTGFDSEINHPRMQSSQVQSSQVQSSQVQSSQVRRSVAASGDWRERSQTNQPRKQVGIVGNFDVVEAVMVNEADPDQQESPDDSSKSWMRMSTLGIELASITLGLAGVGYFIDSRRGHATLYATAAGALIGFSYGMFRFIQKVTTGP